MRKRLVKAMWQLRGESKKQLLLSDKRQNE